MSSESEKVKKKRKKKPLRDVNGYWMKGSNGGYTGRTVWKWTEEKLDSLAEDLISWVDENVDKKKEFLFGDWCFKHKICPPFLNKMVEKSEKMKAAHEYAKGWQEHMIVKGALYKKLDPGFSKFVLLCTHGWKENQGQMNQEEAFKNDFSKFNENMQALKKLVTQDDE
jgi:hypothetical protein